MKAEWIPVSERLPEDGRMVLVTEFALYGSGLTRREVTVGSYDPRWGWADKTAGYEGGRLDHVIAWTPLPEPYQEADDE